MRKQYFCEECSAKLDGFKDRENIFICNKCGRAIKWKDTDINAPFMKDKCHYFNIGKGGYGSELDNKNIQFCLCDTCLVDFINSFEINDEILGLSEKEILSEEYRKVLGDSIGD